MMKKLGVLVFALAMVMTAFVTPVQAGALTIHKEFHASEITDQSVFNGWSISGNNMVSIIFDQRSDAVVGEWKFNQIGVMVLKNGGDNESDYPKLNISIYPVQEYEFDNTFIEPAFVNHDDETMLQPLARVTVNPADVQTSPTFTADIRPVPNVIVDLGIDISASGSRNDLYAIVLSPYGIEQYMSQENNIEMAEPHGRYLFIMYSNGIDTSYSMNYGGQGWQGSTGEETPPFDVVYEAHPTTLDILQSVSCFTWLALGLLILIIIVVAYTTKKAKERRGK